MGLETAEGVNSLSSYWLELPCHNCHDIQSCDVFMIGFKAQTGFTWTDAIAMFEVVTYHVQRMCISR